MDGKNLPCVLAENKCDLLEPSKANNLTDLKKFASENGFDSCFRTSAKTGVNINETMANLNDYGSNNLKKVSSKEFTNDRKSVTLDPEKHENNDSYRQQQKSGCC